MSSGLTMKHTMMHSPLVWKIGDQGILAAVEVVAEVSETRVSVCSLKWLADILSTVLRLPGGQATASSIPAQSTH